jgi:hypothetical protein
MTFLGEFDSWKAYFDQCLMELLVILSEQSVFVFSASGEEVKRIREVRKRLEEGREFPDRLDGLTDHTALEINFHKLKLCCAATYESGSVRTHWLRNGDSTS